MSAPESLGEEFLEWFRELTERQWAECLTPTLESFEAHGVGGAGFVRGTRWSGGLSEAEIADIERRSGLRFPPDYRLFLRKLHCPDRPMLHAGFVDDTRMVIEPYWGFPNWLLDGDRLQEGRSWIEEGFVFDVENNRLWRSEWGAKPETEEGRAQRVAELIAAAPRLIPIYQHRFLVGEPCTAGNPIISIWQTDIIVYGADLRSYLIAEFSREDGAMPGGQEATEAGRGIPFWGSFL